MAKMYRKCITYSTCSEAVAKKIVHVRGPSNINCNTFIIDQGVGGGGGDNKAWDRETMFSQLAKRFPRQRFKKGRENFPL